MANVLQMIVQNRFGFLFLLMLLVSCKERNLNLVTSEKVEPSIEVMDSAKVTTPIKLNKIDSLGRKQGRWITKYVKYFQEENYIDGELHGVFKKFRIVNGDTIVDELGSYRNGIDDNHWFYFYGEDGFFSEKGKRKNKDSILRGNTKVLPEWHSTITNYNFDSIPTSKGQVLYSGHGIFLGEYLKIGKWTYFENDTLFVEYFDNNGLLRAP